MPFPEIYKKFMIHLFLCWAIFAFQAQKDIQPAKKFPEAIEDNSFFIEEAYNQERRVVQHIFEVYYYSRPDKELFFSFTQEWPVFGAKHQLSYTIPYSRLNGNALSGLNDLLINYRYQLLDEENWAAVAPRLSLILPTGSLEKGLGNGVPGVQFCIPASKRLFVRASVLGPRGDSTYIRKSFFFLWHHEKLLLDALLK